MSRSGKFLNVRKDMRCGHGGSRKGDMLGQPRALPILPIVKKGRHENHRHAGRDELGVHHRLRSAHEPRGAGSARRCPLHEGASVFLRLRAAPRRKMASSSTGRAKNSVWKYSCPVRRTGPKTIASSLKNWCGGSFSNPRVQPIAGLVARHADGAVLGCAEIPIRAKPEDAGVPLLDTTALHAHAAAERALR